MMIVCLIEYIYFNLMYSNHTIQATRSKFKLNYNFHNAASVTRSQNNSIKLAQSKIT